MRTKILLSAVAALALGVASSMAQTTYSQNVVGYINSPIPAGGFGIFANQLINGSDPNQTNNSVNTMISSGLVSDPNGVVNTVLYYWNGHGYNVFQYFTIADADTYFGADFGNGFYDNGGALAPGTLNQGAGSFLFNPSGSPVTTTVVGNVLQGTNVVNIVQGFNLLSLSQPIATNIAAAVTYANFPGTSDPNGINNDVLYYWNGHGYNVFQYFTIADADTYFGADSGNGFYDNGGVLFTTPVPVGQAFFIDHLVASPVTWTVTFTVQ